MNLARQKSALLPILQQPVEGRRLSIYNERVHVKHPMLGVLLKNSSSLHLMQGPVTVFEENSYAGDALLPNLRPNEERLISYAVDLGVEVAPSTDPSKPDTEDLVSVKITQGILHATFKQRQTRAYKIANRNKQRRDVVIEHGKQPGWDVVLGKDQKAPTETRDFYRFEVPVAARKTAALEVVLEKKRGERLVLTNSPDDTLRFYFSRTHQEGIKKELKKAIALKSDWAATQRKIQQEREGVATLEKDQTRCRKSESARKDLRSLQTLHRRFEDQENAFDQHRATIAQLQPLADQHAPGVRGVSQ